MKKLHFLLLFVFLLKVNSAFSQTITLPIEVLGPEGYVKEVQFNLDASQQSQAGRLWIQVNNLSYENKASVKFNTTDWISLEHSNTNILYPGKQRGGMTHGGHNTIRLLVDVPTNGLVVGLNTIKFKFNESDGISNGYRVIAMNLRPSSSGTNLLPSSTFVNDDPALWTGVFSDPNAITKGKNLWEGKTEDGSANKVLLNNYLPPTRNVHWYGQDLKIKGSQPINAKCASCHTKDGRDLEIFAYSNFSIAQRAKFHGLTQHEGNLIATYIRSLKDEMDPGTNIGRFGRPWNPPYQPGKNLETRTVDKWAAGAGLGAVLGSDSAMKEHLFELTNNSETITQTKAAQIINPTKKVDQTTMPLAIQLPDWKHWLPMIHPMDAFTKDDYWNSMSKTFNPKQAYEDFRDFLELNKTDLRNGTISSTLATQFLDESREFHRHFRFFLAEGAPVNNHWRSLNGTAESKLMEVNGQPNYVMREFAATSLARLMAVKYFEVMQEFALQDKADKFTNTAAEGNRWQWPGDEYQVFEVPAHFNASVTSPDGTITKTGDSKGQYFEGQPKETGQFESSNWYQLQAVLNDGDGLMNHNSPVDYNYSPEFVLKASKSSGVDEPLRYYYVLNTMYQTKSGSFSDLGPNSQKAFRIRVMGPWYFFGKEADAGSSQFHSFAPREWPNKLESVEPGLRNKVLNVFVERFLNAVEDAPSIDTDTNKYNEGKNRLYNLDGSNYWKRYDSSLPDNGVTNNKSQFLDFKTKSSVVDVTTGGTSADPLYADHMYWTIGEAIHFNINNNKIIRLINWSKAAWPNINWDALTSTNGAVINNEALLSLKAFLNQEGENLHIQGLTKNQYIVNVYDITGKKYITTQFEGDSVKDIDISELPYGLYIITVEGNGEREVIKVYKK
ncbi:T9SS type A sorting domain-containing protein [Ochrovirga pacifica]|uniref:T9SS type A sorting domain-containing protein n=1 Tax=Ochrovirga pacifica TaxID=1042376 RepID=UPI000255A546|nr:T9SS type A sorting domain-containing protein [Ochrovirga pacifica]